MTVRLLAFTQKGMELARRLAAGLCCPVCAAVLQKEWIECLS